MDTTDLDGLDPQTNPMNSESVSEALDATEFSMNYYVLDPGEEFTSGIHAHLDQEEAFLILDGEATFTVQDSPTADGETVTVSDGEMIRFPPGEYQQGRNESDEQVRALALGAPQESTDIRVAIPCQACGESEYLDFVMGDGGAELECPECGNSFEA